MKKLLLLILLFVAFAATFSYGQSCAGLPASSCLAPGTNCKYDFVLNNCTTSTNDTCQNYPNATACTAGGCFYDQYIGKCLTTLYQVQTVFPCPYWSNQQFLAADPYGSGLTSPACSYHGCAFVNNICQVPASAGNIYTYAQTTEIYAEQTLYLNPTVAANSLTFTVTIAEYIVQFQNNPTWSILRILGPQQNLSQYYNYFNTNCSNYNTSAAAGPVPFVANTNYPVSSANISAGFNGYNFNTDQVGTYLRATLGYASVGPGYFVSSVTTDGVYKYSTVTFDMVQKAAQCAAFGAARTVTSSGQTFYFPFAKMDRLIQNGYAEASTAFSINVPTTGTATITTVANYHEQANAIEVNYYQDSCAAGSSRQRITYQFNIRDVFDPSKVVGPRNISDVFSQQPGASGVTNCYGDTISQFTFQGCNYASGICSYQIQTQSRCRVITSDGNAFKFCNGSATADRIADLGSNIAYSSALDGSHSLYFNVYTCAASVCTLTNQSPGNAADPVSVTVSEVVYPGTVITASPFTVTAGFLQTPTSAISQYNPLVNSTGGNGTQFFDGNVFSNQPMNPLILLASPASSKYDLRLRIKPGNITIFPVDIYGQIVTSSIPASLDWATFAASTLYTTKNAYGTGCGAINACQTIPACNGLLGCDGFSVPTQAIKSLMPAVGYRYVMTYDVNSPDANGNFNPGRVLLQVGSDRKLLQTTTQSASSDPTSDQRYGTVQFNIRITDVNGTITETIENVKVSTNTFFHSTKAQMTLYESVIPLFFSGIVFYWFCVEYGYWYNWRKRKA